MNSPKFATFGFLNLPPSNSISIFGSQGIKALSIYVTPDSTGKCTLTGLMPLIGGMAATGITIAPGDPAFNISAGVENMDIDGIIITTGIDCTAKISALQHQILP